MSLPLWLSVISFPSLVVMLFWYLYVFMVLSALYVKSHFLSVFVSLLSTVQNAIVVGWKGRFSRASYGLKLLLSSQALNMRAVIAANRNVYTLFIAIV